MNKYEKFVCDWFLSDYDDTLSYRHVKADILDGIGVIWMLFEDYDTDYLCDLMDNMKDKLEHDFTEKKDD